ncbi:MAG: lytic transglycosylase domain-containing protein [Pelosinus sp.]|nr:lytic transglycosylase domain-containing protein [Pelosinus sp.]
MLMFFVAIVTICGYTLYSSIWFQKKYVYPFPYKEIIYRYALENEVDPILVISVMRTESKFASSAKSPKGAAGLMQMMPETASWVAQQMDYADFSVEQLNDPEVSIRLGTWYLASLKKEFKDNEVLMLAGYNGGRGNVKQWMRQYEWPASFTAIDQIPFKETREYVGKVLMNKQHYLELYHD